MSKHVVGYIPPADRPDIVERVLRNTNGDGKVPTWYEYEHYFQDQWVLQIWRPGRFSQWVGPKGEITCRNGVNALVLHDPNDLEAGPMGCHRIDRIMGTEGYTCKDPAYTADLYGSAIICAYGGRMIYIDPTTGKGQDKP